MQARKRYDPHRINVFPSILSSGRDYAVALHYTVLLIKAGGKIANPGGPTRSVLPIFNLEPVCIGFLLFHLNSGPSLKNIRVN